MDKKKLSIMAAILIAAFFVRVYRIDQILGFYYDQGRDAQVIWDFWHHGKFFLVGPTTGIAGIFRGPWYYWLIAPFYVIGGGNPVWPSVMLAVLTVLGLIILYKLAKEIAGEAAGWIALILGSFSYYIVLASRWLSNPTPMLFISLAFLWSLKEVYRGKYRWWLSIGFLSGMAMQFGSATEVFYFPIIAIIAFLKRKDLFRHKRIAIASFIILVAAFIPQIAFSFRHQGILAENVKKFFVDDKSFRLNFLQMLNIRLPFYLDVFGSKFSPGGYQERIVLLAGMIFALLLKWKTLVKSDVFRITITLFLSPLIGMLFFQGNFGNVYDYYFTGYYLIALLIIAVCISFLWKSWVGKLLLIIIMFMFLKESLVLDRNYIVAGVDGPTTVAFGNEKQVIDWVYTDADGNKFSKDVYVPPVIPYAYDYLFTWYGNGKYGYSPESEMIDPLYTIYEVDPDHPERLNEWLKRQEGIGQVVKQQEFGGVHVQKRLRYETTSK